MTTHNAPSIDSAVRGVRDELRAAGIADAAAEARRLVVSAAGLAVEVLIRDPQYELSQAQCERVTEWLSRRTAGEPLARIRGEKEFYGRTFRLSHDTLEPRADSETLVDVVLELVDQRHGRTHPWRIIDVGTGTGCLLVSLLAELPQAFGLGTDISQGALTIAAGNADRLGVGPRAEWRVADYLNGIDQQFDILVSNPPYIKRDDIPVLQKEVRLFDPVAALDGGGDGLAPYRAMAQHVDRVLARGFGVLEMADHDDQRVADVLTETCQSQRLAILGVWPDLTGCNRCVAFETL